MCLTAAAWDRALLWGGTLLISDVSEDQALKGQCLLSTARAKPAAIWHSCCLQWSRCPLARLLQGWGFSWALTRIKQELVTALCSGEMESVPTHRKRCRTFGCSWHSLTSTLQTLLPSPWEGAQPLAAAPWAAVDAEVLPCPTVANKETKPVLLTNRFICILTGAQILDTDFFCTTVQEPVQNMPFFFIYPCTKKPQKPTNEKTKSVAAFTHNWYASASHAPTSTRPCPSCQLCGQHCLPLTAALSVKR